MLLALYFIHGIDRLVAMWHTAQRLPTNCVMMVDGAQEVLLGSDGAQEVLLGSDIADGGQCDENGLYSSQVGAF